MTAAFILEDVVYRFGLVNALDGLSLAVRQGEVYGFLGRNGAGKTTTLRLLMGILRPHGGSIELLGSRVTRVSVALKRRIGYVSQEPTFYPWMNAQQLGGFVGSFYPTWDAAEYLRLLRMLDVPPDRRAAELSGGTRSKLGLALALAPRPDLLLLDEPTAGLDPVARAEFNDQLILLHRERGTTVFFSSHLVGEVEKLADRVGIVQAGRTRFEGSVVDLQDSVRRMALADDAVPAGFERLRGDIFRADPARWEEAAASGISVGEALAGGHLPRLRAHGPAAGVMHPLVRKELREHRGVLIAMWVLCALGLLALLLASLRQGSPVFAWRMMLVVFGPLLSLALANRFVVREYGGRTQFFLETLPMGRAQIITVKWLTSAACLLVPMALCFGLILVVAASKVELTPRFALLLALRGFVFLMFVHALAFFVGLTGRYRYVLWMAMIVLGIIAGTFWQAAPQQWPPLQLVSDAMPFERELAPVRELWITAAITVGLIAATYSLALGFQGSWVAALARRMSRREKIVVTAAFISVVYVIILVQDRKPKPAFSVQDGMISAIDLPRVMVARAEGLSTEAATALADGFATQLQEVQDYLAIEKLPVVAVLPDASIDPELFLLADLPDSDGVVVRGAAGSGRFDEAGFRAFTLRQVLDWHSRGRASREPRRWLLEGFSRWHIARNDAAQRELLSLRSVAALQMLESGRIALAPALRRWLTTREHLGDCLGDALAWRATEWLSVSLGEEKFRQLARALFGQRPTSDIRAFLSEKTVDELLRAPVRRPSTHWPISCSARFMLKARALPIACRPCCSGRCSSRRCPCVARSSNCVMQSHPPAANHVNPMQCATSACVPGMAN